MFISVDISHISLFLFAFIFSFALQLDLNCSLSILLLTPPELVEEAMILNRDRHRPSLLSDAQNRKILSGGSWILGIRQPHSDITDLERVVVGITTRSWARMECMCRDWRLEKCRTHPERSIY
jgi:hypothetical protein